MAGSGEHAALPRFDEWTHLAIFPIRPMPVDMADVTFRPGHEPTRLRMELHRPEDLPALQAAGHHMYVLPDGQVIVLRAFRPEIRPVR